MRVKLLEGLPPFKKKEKKEKVYVALKGEVCVRTDLVRSVTTDVTKQAVGSGRAGCTGTAVFNQYSRWEKTSSLTPFPWYSLFLLLALFHSYQQATVHN